MPVPTSLSVAFTQATPLADTGTGTDTGWPNYNDPYYITNLCTNPSFETSLAGWTATSGTHITQTNLQALYGTQSMQVTTPGSVPGEGVYGPHGAYPFAEGYASMCCSIFGETGSLLVSFVNAAGGVVLASQAVVLNGSGWQTITFTGIGFSPGAQYYVLITTLGVPQAITFNIDGVMYTPDGQHLTPYVDGDQPGCLWTGTAGIIDLLPAIPVRHQRQCQFRHGRSLQCHRARRDLQGYGSTAAIPL